MCGIAGFSLHPNDTKINPTTLATTLLHGIEPRGRDATGYAATTPTGDLHFNKAPLPAHQFTPNMNLPGVTTAVLHTRFATQGTPQDNNNNHPLHVGTLYGVHNGMIWNDRAIYHLLGYPPEVEVDTAAIYHLLANGTPKLADIPTKTLKHVQGSAALAWIDTNQPNTLHLARLERSPLITATIGHGSLIFASNSETLKAAARKTRTQLSNIQACKENTYLEIVNGTITTNGTPNNPLPVINWQQPELPHVA